MSLVNDHWEWDRYWSARRNGSRPALLGHLAPERSERVDVGGTEVTTWPGHCIAWTASEGHCWQPTDGLVCAKHHEDFAPLEARITRLTAEDLAYLATLPEEQYAKARNNLSMKRAREDPEYKDRINAKRRAMRAARTWTS